MLVWDDILYTFCFYGELKRCLSVAITAEPFFPTASTAVIVLSPTVRPYELSWVLRHYLDLGGGEVGLEHGFCRARHGRKSFEVSSLSHDAQTLPQQACDLLFASGGGDIHRSGVPEQLSQYPCDFKLYFQLSSRFQLDDPYK